MTDRLYTCELIDLGNETIVNETIVVHDQHCDGIETRVGEYRFRNEIEFVNYKNITTKLN